MCKVIGMFIVSAILGTIIGTTVAEILYRLLNRR